MSCVSVGKRSDTGPFGVSEASSPDAMHIIEYASCCPLRQSGYACSFAALEFATDERFLQQPRRLGLQRFAALDIGAKPLRQCIKLKQARHEGDLVETHAQEPQR